MKELVKTSRLAGSLEKLFRKLNADFFDGELETPIITIQSTPKAYGHYSTYNAWSVKGEGHREINLGAGTLDRPIEYTCATLLHEMCHMYNDTVLHEQDTSSRGHYHNKVFKRTAEEHGLICTQTVNGWSDTSTELSDRLIEWVLANDLTEILMVRNEGIPAPVNTTTGKGKAASSTTDKPPRKNNSILCVCPKCGAKARITKDTVRIGCWDCMVEMVRG